MELVPLETVVTTILPAALGHNELQIPPRQSPDALMLPFTSSFCAGATPVVRPIPTFPFAAALMAPLPKGGELPGAANANVSVTPSKKTKIRLPSHTANTSCFFRFIPLEIKVLIIYKISFCLPLLDRDVRVTASAFLTGFMLLLYHKNIPVIGDISGMTILLLYFRFSAFFRVHCQIFVRMESCAHRN